MIAGAGMAVWASEELGTVLAGLALAAESGCWRFIVKVAAGGMAAIGTADDRVAL